MQLELITTGSHINKKIEYKKRLYLGTWCLKFEEYKNYLNQPDSCQINDYHWKDKKKMEKDINKIFDIFNKNFHIIAKYLNKYHKKKYKADYWKFLIGPWVFMFTHVFFDRYKMIYNVSNKYKNLVTYVPKNALVSETFAQFYNFCQSHDYNFFLMSDILKNFNTIKKNKILFNFKIEKKNKPLHLKRFLNFIIESFKNAPYLFKKNMRKNNKIELITSDLSIKEQDYFIKKKQLNFFPVKLNLNQPKIKSRPRPKINHQTKNKLVRIYLNVLVKHIPLEYMENYNFWVKKVNRCNLAEKPKTIIMRAPAEFSSFVRFYCAEKKLKGAEIIGMQHGGGYGIDKYKGVDHLEIDLVDKYLTWGWSNPKKKKTIKFFVTKTYWKKKFSYNQKGKILLVHRALRNYYFYPQNHPSSSNRYYTQHIDKLLKFLKPKPKKILRNRFHFNYNVHDEKIFKEKFNKSNRFSREDKSHFFDQFSKTRLMIITSNFTSFLQCFLMNIPTILFLEKKFDKVLGFKKSYYNELEKAKILFYDPKKCSKHINDIYSNPKIWWNKSNVQKAKNKFCKEFARYSENVGNELSILLK